MSKAVIEDQQVVDPDWPAGPPGAASPEARGTAQAEPDTGHAIDEDPELQELTNRLNHLQASMDLWGQTPEQTVTTKNKHSRGGPGAVIMFVGSILFIIGSVAGIFFRDQLPAFIPVSFQRMDAEPSAPAQYLSDPYEREFVPAGLQPTPPVPPSQGSVVAEPPATGADAVAEIEKKVTQTNLASSQIHPVGPFLMGRTFVPPLPPTMPEPPPAKVEDAPPLPKSPEPELPAPAAPDPEPVAIPGSAALPEADKPAKPVLRMEDRGLIRSKTPPKSDAKPVPAGMKGRSTVSRRVRAVAAKPAPLPAAAPAPEPAPKSEPGTVHAVNGYVGL